MRRQAEAGIDVVNDGEIGKTTWITYLYERVTGLETRMVPLEGTSILAAQPRPRERSPASTRSSTRSSSTRTGESADIGDVENYPDAPPEGMKWACTGPIEYDTTELTGHRQPQEALEGVDVTDAFLPVVAPASALLARQRALRERRGFVYGLADALHDEYKAIVDAGLLLQVDDAVLMHEARHDHVPGGVLEGLPRVGGAARGRDQPRLARHPAGSRPVPHLLGQLARPARLRPAAEGRHRLVLKVNAGTYAIEQANARHEHEWRVWEDVKLPDGKKLIPGVVSHHTNVVEHPELVAQRLVRLANVVGGENVLAGTDCGFAQGAFVRRVHPEIQWAKLAALSEGAQLASRELWGAAAAV